jgi:hypothetical protein
MKQKAFQAYANGCTVTASSARKAAQKFFETFKGKRKCNVTEGTVDGPFFTVVYGRASDGEWPQRFTDVTKKTIETLPDVDFPEATE